MAKCNHVVHSRIVFALQKFVPADRGNVTTLFAVAMLGIAVAGGTAIDELEVYVVPEPAGIAMWLAGMAAAMALRNRRRADHC